MAAFNLILSTTLEVNLKCNFFQKAKDRLGFVPSDLDSTFKSTVEWYDHLFLHDDHEREEMIARLLQNIVPPNKKNQARPMLKSFYALTTIHF